METVQIALNMASTESVLLHASTRLLQDSMGSILISLTPDEASQLAIILGQATSRFVGVEERGLPFNTSVIELIRSFFGPNAVNAGRSLQISQISIRSVSVEPWDRYDVELAASIDANRNQLFEVLRQVSNERLETRTVVRTYPEPYSHMGHRRDGVPSAFDIATTGRARECRIRFRVDVTLSASRESVDGESTAERSAVQSFHLDVVPRAQLRESAGTPLFSRSSDGTLLRRGGVPAVVPIVGLKLEVERAVLIPDETLRSVPLVYRDSSFRSDEIGTQSASRYDLWGYLCFGRQRPNEQLAPLPPFEGVLRLLQRVLDTAIDRAVQTALESPERDGGPLEADLNELLGRWFRRLADFNQFGALHGLDFAPHYSRLDPRAALPRAQQVQVPEDPRFVLDERWFVWFFGAAVTDTQLRINIQLAQPGAFGWKPRHLEETDYFYHLYFRNGRVAASIPSESLRTSPDRWQRFFERPSDLPELGDRSVCVRLDTAFLASVGGRLLDEVLDDGLSSASIQLKRRELVKQPTVNGRDWAARLLSPPSGVSMPPEQYERFLASRMSAWIVRAGFPVDAWQDRAEYVLRRGGWERDAVLESPPNADLLAVLDLVENYTVVVANGGFPEVPVETTDDGRWIVRALRAIRDGGGVPPTSREKSEARRLIDWFFSALQCRWLDGDAQT